MENATVYANPKAYCFLPSPDVYSARIPNSAIEADEGTLISIKKHYQEQSEIADRVIGELKNKLLSTPGRNMASVVKHSR